MIKLKINKSASSPLKRGDFKISFFKTNLLFIVLLFSGSVFAQNSERIFKELIKNDTGIEIKTNDGKYLIKAINEYIIETSFIPQGESYNPNSHAVVLKSKNIQTELTESNSQIDYGTQGIKVSIQKTPFQINYTYQNRLLLSEKSGYIKTDSTEVLDFNITSKEVLYGGGARVLGMNRRGHRLELYNKAHYGYETHSELMNFTMPLVLSSKIYMLHFDNAPIGFLDLDSKKNNTLSYETIGGRKTYQVIAADDWRGLMHHYTDLTGKQPLPPRWALGNFASRMGYHSEKETRETVQKFEEHNIPLDAVIIDLYWFGADLKGTMGNLEFLKDSFPTPKKMMADFKSKGVKTILITEPFILSNSKKWKETSEQGLLGKNSLGEPYTYDFYFGNTGIIDIYNPKAKAWFWDIYKGLHEMGVSGWWGDLGEPEVHPSDLIHEAGTADEVHNIYGHDWAKLIFEGYQKEIPHQRPFILMRAGYSGSQRFGMIPWSGDVNRTWGGLQAQPEIALQMGMQGMAYMHSDLGGFAGGEVLDSELYTRWLQYGVFQPVFRPHAQESVAAEPVFHDDKTIALAKKAIELRYQLLPYNYTLSFDNSTKGDPLMRPLFFEEPGNEKLLNTAKAYLWGDNFLVSPILHPGIKEQQVYFPKSNHWFDFFTDEKIAGGITKTVKTHEDHIPVFVRSGAFIPMIDIIQTTKDYQINHLKLHYYFDEDVSESSGKLYHDDGLTPNAYSQEKFEIINFKSAVKGGYLSIEIASEIGKNYVAQNKDITLIIHNISAKPKKIKGYNYQWDNEKNHLSIPVKYSNKKQTIKIKL